jgi:hypothetical protein
MAISKALILLAALAAGADEAKPQAEKPARPAKPLGEMAVIAEKERPPAEALWKLVRETTGEPQKTLRSFVEIDREGRIVSVSLPQGAGDDFLTPMLSLGQLQNVDASGAAITEDALAQLIILPSLKELNVAGMEITDAGAETIGVFDLRMLDLSGTKITDDALAAIGGLANLEVLKLDGTGVTDAGLAHLEGLKKLRRLSLVETSVTPEGVQKLKAALRKELSVTPRTSLVENVVIHFSAKPAAPAASEASETPPSEPQPADSPPSETEPDNTSGDDT